MIYLVGIARLKMLRELFLVFYKSKVTISLNYASGKSGTVACFKCLILLHLRILLHPRISGFLIAVPKAPRKKCFSGIHIFYEIRDNIMKKPLLKRN